MVKDKILHAALALVTALAIAVGGSAVIASCDDQDGGYPTPQLRSDAR